MKILRPVVLAFIFILILTFIIQNYDALLYKTTFKIEFFNLRAESMPVHLYLLVFIAFFLGTLLCALYCIVDMIRMKNSLRVKGAELKRVQKELTAVRSTLEKSKNESELKDNQKPLEFASALQEESL